MIFVLKSSNLVISDLTSMEMVMYCIVLYVHVLNILLHRIQVHDWCQTMEG